MVLKKLGEIIVVYDYRLSNGFTFKINNNYTGANYTHVYVPQK